jgi:hypothetical protein
MDHTPECEAARASVHRQPGDDSPNWPHLSRLDADGRAAVLACPHWSHDAVRRFVEGPR